MWWFVEREKEICKRIDGTNGEISHAPPTNMKTRDGRRELIIYQPGSPDFAFFLSYLATLREKVTGMAVTGESRRSERDDELLHAASKFNVSTRL